MISVDAYILTILLTLLLSLLAMAALSRAVSLRVQAIIYYLTGSGDLASIGIFLLLLPGVFLHEGAHWLTARLLGLRAGKFRVWPTKQGAYIGLGSVSVERADIWRESLVGVAPLVVGNLVLAWIGWRVFATPTLLATLTAGNLAAAVSSFGAGLHTSDGLAWAYAIFAIGNSMMPSASDREPFKPVLLYALFATVIYVIVGLPLTLLGQLLGWIAPAIEISVGALIFLIVLDGLVWLTLWPIEWLLRRGR
ncbi:MAG TPA: hypothetical protein DCL15_20215 [Chloroflexi bacterium]|nr:hypothetical protein [Chloroflexota bacterium]HHW84838.1 hypothetical protein [Chloroflexota bacterium]